MSELPPEHSTTPPPVQSVSADARSANPEPPAPVSARAHAWFWLAIGVAMIGVLQVPMALLAHRSVAAPSPPPTSASATPSAAPPSQTSPAIAASASAAPDEKPAFRVAQLESESIEVLHTRVGKRSCAHALEALAVLTSDIPRIAAAVAPHRKIEGCNPNDHLFVALGRADRKLHGVEIETAPGEIVQVVERDGALVAESVTLPVTHRRYTTAFVVVSDLASAIASAGLDASLIEPLDEAIGSRHDVPAPAAGSTFRVIADATLVAGRFDRWDELVAFEYRARPDATPLRLYHVAKPSSGGKPVYATGGWFDSKGHQPLRAKYRMPLAFPRITSRFNPKRKHPVLKVVMPHNGCDFGAKTGTPVYAIGAGTVSFRGEAGPSGNLITIHHGGGIESGYAHLSRFAAGIVPGTHVEPRTLIGYVGTTGRSTGPHLHLSVKRNGVFIDPLSLKLDGFRVVPPADRSGFAARKSEADATLDAIPLPGVDVPAPAASAVNDDQAEHADEHGD